MESEITEATVFVFIRMIRLPVPDIGLTMIVSKTKQNKKSFNVLMICQFE